MRKRVLVVDDEPDLVTLVESRLNANGYDVVTAYSGAEGLEKCILLKPDAVVLDILMPDVDGSTMAAQMKEDPRTRQIPIIFLTAIIEPKEVPKNHLVGGRYFLAKPFESKELLEMLKCVLPDNVML